MTKKILFFLFLTLIFLGTANLVFAVEVTDGPCANSANLGACTVSLFKWGIGIAAVLAALSFAVGAITLTISGDNSGLAGSGKDRMKGSVYGLVLVGASYLIMNTINFALVTPGSKPLTETALPTVPVAPGVYFYADAGCGKDASYSTVVSEESIGANINGIKVVNDTANGANTKYGYVLHKIDGLANGGPCGKPVTSSSGCQGVNGMHGAIDVFQINSQDSSTSGDGVTFYSRPYGLDRGSRAGYYAVESGSINDHTSPTADSMTFKWDGVDASQQEQNDCSTFKKCPGSIDLKGDYLVAVYSNKSTSGGSGGSGDYCQTFTDNVNDLDAEPVVGSGSRDIQNIYIIPTGGAAR